MVHGRLHIISLPSAPALQAGGCHATRTLLAFVLPSGVLSVSKVNRSPILILSGSIPADFSSLTCKNISGPPASSAINPKPRAAFHIFNFPAAILFSLRLQPQLDEAANLSFRVIFPHIPESVWTLQEFILAKLTLCRRSGRVGMLIDCLGRKLSGAGGSFCGRTSC